MSRDVVEEAAGLVKGSGLSGRHTFYQLKHFVLGKEVTTQAKMWKCIRELEARVGAARSIMNGIAEAEDDLRILDIRTQVLEKKKSKSDLHREYKEIRGRKLGRRRSALEESISDMRRRLGETEEEMKFFLGAYRQLEAIEPLRSHDDPEANAQYWNQNFAQELQLRMMLQRPLDTELVKCILAMHEDSSVRTELVGMLEQIQRMAGGYKGSGIDQRGKSIEENIEL